VGCDLGPIVCLRGNRFCRRDLRARHGMAHARAIDLPARFRGLAVSRRLAACRLCGTGRIRACRLLPRACGHVRRRRRHARAAIHRHPQRVGCRRLSCAGESESARWGQNRTGCGRGRLLRPAFVHQAGSRKPAIAQGFRRHCETRAQSRTR
jgi:hypothetical protein